VSKTLKFIDLFAGIGGFHIAFNNLGGKCVFACEIDKSARETYKVNHKISDDIFAEDITKVESINVPNHDILCAGFPCQPFSQAGFKKGFDDIRGTLFFDIARIIEAKNPKAIFLENVQHLLKHDDGRTFKKIRQVVTEQLGYSFYHKVVRASDFGVPQHRPRLFMVGFKDDKRNDFLFPKPVDLKITMSDILGGQCNKKVGYTLRVGGRGSKIDDRRNWDSYLVDGNVKRISPKEGLVMQGFPKDFTFTVSKTQAMKQLGNSVAVPAIQAVAQQILNKILDIYNVIVV
jgi:DNA (cytosine-5)-methyltransferase 1